MDRHDVSESVTAAHVAQLHRADLKIQDHFGCKGLTYWFDDKRKTAFCLIEALNEQALRALHDKAYQQIPHRIMVAVAGIVGSFSGSIEDPHPKEANTLNFMDDPAFRTIMFLAKEPLYANYKVVHTSADTMTEFQEVVRHNLHTCDGRIVKENENHFLVSFKSVSKAVSAALKIKTKINEPEFDNISLKPGLSSGVPVTEKKSIFEDTITLAERICTMIPGEIIISADVAALSGSENVHTF